jgi:transcriptional regulator with XRE-family HTH domain
MVSQKLKNAVKTNLEPAYKIAQKANLSQSMMSQLLNGIVDVKPGDERVIRIGKVLGLDESECFEIKNKNIRQK